MLILQYSAKERQPKGDITYTNYKGVIIVVLMRDSPDFLKNSKSNRYIHRITKAVTDSGIELESRRKIAFVQLDKALEQFLKETYNRDEDYELLVELAMLKDPNNDKVKQAVMKRDQFKSIYADAAKFSLDKEVQFMTLKDEFRLFDYDYTMNKEKAISKAEGKTEGEARLNALNSWLFSNGRDEDVKKATLDKEFRTKLFEEFDKAQEPAS